MNILARRTGVGAYTSGFIIICALAVGAPPASAQETATRYVVADVMRIRAAPAKDAKVIANLRIGARVRKADSGAPEDGWVKVVLDTDPPLTGYLAGAFLSPEKPRAADLLAHYEAAVAAGALGDARTAAERLAALEPDKDVHLERLKALYAKLGDTGRARRMEAYLKGGGIKYIGYCLSGRPDDGRLLAAFHPERIGHPSKGPLQILMKRSHRYGFDREYQVNLPELTVALQRSSWFRLGAPQNAESLELPSISMLDAKVVRPPEFKGPGLRWGPFIAVPGCMNRGDILSSEPLEGISLDPVRSPQLIETIEDSLDPKTSFFDFTIRSLTVRTIPGPRLLLSVQVRIEDPVGKNPGGEDSLLWALYDRASGKRLMLVGGHWRTQHMGGVQQKHLNVGRITWFKWRRSQVRIAIIEHHVLVEHQIKGAVVLDRTGDRIGVYAIDEENKVHEVRLLQNWVVED